ncbi:MAG: CBS domain-containing protein [Acidobacteriota bacterium]
MTNDVSSCAPESDLASAAMTMWHRDCGTVPVVGSDGRVMGMLTDRDICIAVATRGLSADRIAVRDVMTGVVMACAQGDPVTDALITMRSAKVRRLPVVDDQGRLAGIVSITDIVRNARDPSLVSEIVETLKAIGDPAPLSPAARERS